MLARNKRRTIALTAVLILGLIVVAVPMCSTGVCDMTPTSTHMASGASPSAPVPLTMGGTVSHAVSGSVSHAGSGIVAAVSSVSSTMGPAFRALCTVINTTIAAVDRILAAAGSTLLLSLLGMLAMAVLFLRSAPALVRLPALAGDSHARPDDLRGVRLLN